MVHKKNDRAQGRHDVCAKEEEKLSRVVPTPVPVTTERGHPRADDCEAGPG